MDALVGNLAAQVAVLTTQVVRFARTRGIFSLTSQHLPHSWEFYLHLSQLDNSRGTIPTRFFFSFI